MLLEVRQVKREAVTQYYTSIILNNTYLSNITHCHIVWWTANWILRECQGKQILIFIEGGRYGCFWIPEVQKYTSSLGFPLCFVVQEEIVEYPGWIVEIVINRVKCSREYVREVRYKLPWHRILTSSLPYSFFVILFNSVVFFRNLK